MTIEPILPPKTTRNAKRLTCFFNFSLNPFNAVMGNPKLGLALGLERCKGTHRVDGFKLAIPSSVKATAACQHIIPEGLRFIAC